MAFLLESEGKFEGNRLKYPFYAEKFDIEREKTLINDDDELFEYIFKNLGNEFNKNKKISQVMQELGVPIGQIFDSRTYDIIEKYYFYGNNPDKIDNEVWYEAYITIRRIEKQINNRRMF